MARTVFGIRLVLAVVLQQCVELGTTRIQYPGEVQRNVGRVVGMGLAKFLRPITKQLALVSAFFGDCDEVFLHFKYQ